MTMVYSVVIGLALLVVFLALLVVGLLRTQGEILRILNQLGVRLDEADSSDPITLSSSRREAANEIVGVTPEGDPVVTSVVSGTDPVLLAFLSTTCTSCSEFWDAIAADEMMLHNARYRVLVVTLGPDEESPTRAIKLKRGTVDVVMSSDAWARFEVPGAPYFAVVDPTSGQVIGEGSAANMAALTTFLGDAAGDQRWDREARSDRTDRDREEIVDAELRRAGLLPGDPRLYHPPDTKDGS